MNTKCIFLSLMMTCVMMSQDVMAQVVDDDVEMSDEEFDRMSFNDFRKRAKSDFESFRKKCIDEYTDFLRKTWQGFEQQKPLPNPVIEEVPPVVIPKKDRNKPIIKDKPVVKDTTVIKDESVVLDTIAIENNGTPVIEESLPPIKIRRIPIDVVVPQPRPVPQPKPVIPIIPKRQPKPSAPVVDFMFYGVDCRVPFKGSVIPQMDQVSENIVADAVESVSKYSDFESTMATCLKWHEDLQLSDWAYLQFLETFATAASGSYDNRAVLLQGLLYSLSGYRMRFGSDQTRLYLFFASQHQIYRTPFYKIDGDFYFPYKLKPSSEAYISRAAMPKEQSLSLYIKGTQQFEYESTSERQIVSDNYKDFKLTISVNKNDIDFYNTYPSSEVGGNFMTRWAMYANTPLHPNVRLQILSELQPQLSGLSKREAVERLLNLVQTGLEYEYDETVWGGDRAFFAEESLFYPYCDCEDRSILFTRLVRELLGLKCMLIYYPGHLASAVCFEEEVRGDYIEYNGKRFTVCDPTFIGAPVGATMPRMDNKSAKVIVL